MKTKNLYLAGCQLTYLGSRILNFIEYSEFGEFLVNGLVGEIIREANVEDAVAHLSDKIAT